VHRPYFWLHIKKAGGQSVRAGLTPHYVETDRKLLRPLDEVPPAERNDWINSYRQDFGRYDAHRMRFARDVVYTPEEFDRMFKFAFVRNPWDRAVSIWLHMGERKRKLPSIRSARRRFKDFLLAIPDMLATSGKYSHEACHAARMLPDLTSDDGRTLLVDFVGRIERFQQDFDHVCEAIDLPARPLSHENPRRLRDGQRVEAPSLHYYDAEARRLVGELYAEDIEFFGYEFSELEAKT
jgi:hypothetical protein